MKKIAFVVAVLLNSTLLIAQESPVQFYFQVKRTSDSTAQLKINAGIKKGFGLFSFAKQNAEDPFISALNIDTASLHAIVVKDSIVAEQPAVKQTENATNYYTYSDTASFSLALKIKSKEAIKLKGEIAWLGKQADAFPNGIQKFSVEIPVADIAASQAPATAPHGWALFFLCLLAGFLAVFTPCVFPLIPVTVSFFLKKSKTRGEGLKKAWWYTASIILIYAVPTLIFTLIFGDKFIYRVSTHPISNLIFFAIDIVFAISFFGAFEIGLPSSWANKTDEAAQRGGYAGIFFMAVTLVIVSFSCTGPIVAGLLSETSGKGVSMGPAIGMLGFGVGLAIPFGIFALFPSMLHSLPRSGAWLNTVKVFFGFIILALAMKFLSNADLVYHWHLLNRDVFLAIWIVNFVLLGFYLLGKLKFSHDSELPHITVTRLFIAIASFTFAMYLVPGLWGAPLKPLSGILPPPATQDFNLDELKYNTAGSFSHTSTEAEQPVKYKEIFHVPFGLTAYFDLEEGLAAAKKLNKPVMIDFTGWSCGNCRKMENEVWSQPEVLQILKNDFVLVSLYVDDKTELPEAEQYTNKDGDKIVTIGDKNLDYEKSTFNINAQPLYKFLDLNRNSLSDVQYGYVPDAPKFIAHLQMVKNKFYGQR